MILIAHRGNLRGPNPKKENSPYYIKKALEAGFNVEVDVWFKNNRFWLGHDQPQYKTTLTFLNDSRIWCHAKNFKALCGIRGWPFDSHNYFWHQNDNFTLTNHGCIWTFPGYPLSYESIAVMPEQVNYSDEELKGCLGVCTDYVYDYKRRLNV